MKQNNLPKEVGSLLISYDFTKGHDEGDHCVLIVGKQRKGVVTIINEFQDEKAIEVYNKIMEGAHEKPY